MKETAESSLVLLLQCEAMQSAQWATKKGSYHAATIVSFLLFCYFAMVMRKDSHLPLKHVNIFAM